MVVQKTVTEEGGNGKRAPLRIKIQDKISVFLPCKWGAPFLPCVPTTTTNCFEIKSNISGPPSPLFKCPEHRRLSKQALLNHNSVNSIVFRIMSLIAMTRMILNL